MTKESNARCAIAGRFCKCMRYGRRWGSLRSGVNAPLGARLTGSTGTGSVDPDGARFLELCCAGGQRGVRSHHIVDEQNGQALDRRIGSKSAAYIFPACRSVQIRLRWRSADAPQQVGTNGQPYIALRKRLCDHFALVIAAPESAESSVTEARPF